jgi:hypothetical protein
MIDELSELLQRESLKRDRNWHPAARWKVIEATIDWVDSQAAVPRNSKAGCLAHQAQLLGRVAAQISSTAPRS